MFQNALRSLRRTTIRTIVAGAVTVGTLEITTHLPTQGRSSSFYHYLSDEWVTLAMRRFLDPEVAHHVAIFFSKRGLSPQHHPSVSEQRVSVSSQVFDKKIFPNPIGLAAGFDKDGEIIEPLLRLGFGFVEIGTVTPQPQAGNPKPRMFRLLEDKGIINRYGFNSAGAQVVAANLKQFRQPIKQEEEELHEKEKKGPGAIDKVCRTADCIWKFLYPSNYKRPAGLVGVNIGKNKDTVDAIADYVYNIQLLGPYADYMVINVSSPNTAGLRDWQQVEPLRSLLEACLQERDNVVAQTQRTLPLLVKLAPDLSDEELEQIAKLAVELRLDGLVVTNTTKTRPADLVSIHRHQSGGLSGQPVKDSSTACIRKLYAYTDGSIPIIGVGGVASGHDAYEKLKAGASLVQVYSMMVYAGPGLVSRIRHELAQLMIQNGQRSIDDVIGLDHEDIFWRKRQERMNKKQRENILVIDGL